MVDESENQVLSILWPHHLQHTASMVSKEGKGVGSCLGGFHRPSMNVTSVTFTYNGLGRMQSHGHAWGVLGAVGYPCAWEEAESWWTGRQPQPQHPMGPE